jgi:hypothetical protein
LSAVLLVIMYLTLSAVILFSFISLASGSCPKCGGLESTTSFIEYDYRVIDETVNNSPFENEAFSKGDEIPRVLENKLIIINRLDDKSSSFDIEEAKVEVEPFDAEAFDDDSADDSTSLLGYIMPFVPDRSVQNWLQPNQKQFVLITTVLGIVSLSLFPEGRIILGLFMLSHLLTCFCYFLINVT